MVGISRQGVSKVLFQDQSGQGWHNTTLDQKKTLTQKLSVNLSDRKSKGMDDKSYSPICSYEEFVVDRLNAEALKAKGISQRDMATQLRLPKTTVIATLSAPWREEREF